MPRRHPIRRLASSLAALVPEVRGAVADFVGRPELHRCLRDAVGTGTIGGVLSYLGQHSSDYCPNPWAAAFAAAFFALVGTLYARIGQGQPPVPTPAPEPRP